MADHAGNLRRVVLRHAEPFAQRRVPHAAAVQKAQRRMLVAGPASFFGRHLRETTRAEQNRPRGARFRPKLGRRQAVLFRLGNHFVDAGSHLLAQPEAAHERRQRPVARAGREVDEPFRRHQRSTRIGDLQPVPEQLDRRPCAAHRHVLVDQRIGDDLANGHRRNERARLSNRRIAILARRQQDVDVRVQVLEAVGVAAQEVLAMSHRGGTAVAVVGHESNGLARQARLEVAQVLGEQDGAEIADVPLAAHVGRDQLISFERRERAFDAALRRQTEQLEVALDVQQRQHRVCAGESSGNAGLPSVGPQFVPQRPQAVGIVGQPRRGAADAVVGGSLELHRRRGGGGHFQQHDSPLRMLDGLKGERHARPQPLIQPELERLALVSCRGRLEGRADDRMIGVANAPDDVAGILPGNPGGVRDAGDQFADHGRIVVVLLELGQRRLGRLRPQLVDQREPPLVLARQVHGVNQNPVKCCIRP